MKGSDLRSIGRSSLARAKVELEKNDPNCCRYAALELRMALEALTYERAFAYRSYLPIEQIDAWQPRHVLKSLLAIDCRADTGGSISIGLEETPGVEAKEFEFLGTEHVLSLGTIKDHYDALGSYLHLPSLKSIHDSKPVDLTKLRTRCLKVVAAVEEALSSRIYGVVFGVDHAFDCIRCRERISRRTPLTPYEFNVTCSNCNALYNLRSETAGEVHIRPNTKDVECLRDGCEGVHTLWGDQFNVGHKWECASCGALHTLNMRVMVQDD